MTQSETVHREFWASKPEVNLPMDSYQAIALAARLQRETGKVHYAEQHESGIWIVVRLY